ncbi:MAG: 5'-3' exonuclease H3TH domain-containing protein [Dehalococcoidia bacterium]
MQVYLLDGTYELFRHYFAVPSSKMDDGTEVGALRGVLGSVLSLLENDTTHLGVATDHVIESFRNDLWPGYKRGAGIEPELLAQFPLLEDALTAMGVLVWPMTDYEADDALATAAAATAKHADRVVICTPDKDLAQCVVGEHIVQLDRRSRRVFDEAGVIAKFGVAPASIPDYLALVGDSADGFPGLPGWGAKSAAKVLARYRHLDAIPADPSEWQVDIRGATSLAATLVEQQERARLFKDLATLRTSVPIDTSVEALRWSGPRRTFGSWAERLRAPALAERAKALAAARR